MRTFLILVLGAALLAVTGCTTGSHETVQLAEVDLESLDGVHAFGLESDLDAGLLGIDTIATAGGASLRIHATKPVRIRLASFGNIDIEDARLIYQASVRSEDIEGAAYLEMWCQFFGMGEYFSRGLDYPILGTSDWEVRSTPFFLQRGQNPDSVKLNLVIDGSGTVWVDDLKLLRAEL